MCLQANLEAKIHSLEEIIVKSSSTVSDSAIKANKVRYTEVCLCGDCVTSRPALFQGDKWFIDCHLVSLCSVTDLYLHLVSYNLTNFLLPIQRRQTVCPGFLSRGVAFTAPQHCVAPAGPLSALKSEFTPRSQRRVTFASSPIMSPFLAHFDRGSFEKHLEVCVVASSQELASASPLRPILPSPSLIPPSLPPHSLPHSLPSSSLPPSFRRVLLCQ